MDTSEKDASLDTSMLALTWFGFCFSKLDILSRSCTVLILIVFNSEAFLETVFC